MLSLRRALIPLSFLPMKPKAVYFPWKRYAINRSKQTYATPVADPINAAENAVLSGPPPRDARSRRDRRRPSPLDGRYTGVPSRAPPAGLPRAT
ncbi:hypothetical protein B296_00046684 [Ensete ventricosum]|uniref:Uncharacterized protein n=1 Tax=Ensete ventricosum TaxID=4639 RepID=A0A426YCW0_ENSVE|nr:hypothetical protein B296_00046684 [Ensete ventricosum]